MADANIRTTVSIEAVLHRTFRKFVQEISDQYGVKITTVDFDWIDRIGAPPVIWECRVQSTTTINWSGPGSGEQKRDTAWACPSCAVTLDPPDPLDEGERYCRSCGYLPPR